MNFQNAILFILLASGAIVTISVQIGGGGDASVKIVNCVGENVDLESYGKDDVLMSIPYAVKKDISHGSRATMTCGSGGKCQIRIKGPSCGGDLKADPVKSLSDGKTALVYATGEWRSYDIKMGENRLQGTWPVLEVNTSTSTSCAGYVSIRCPTP